jgi:hypothetical protein
VNRRALYVAIAISILVIVALASTYTYDLSTNQEHSTSLETTSRFGSLNTTYAGLVVESAALTEATPSSNAYFTLFVANLGNSTFIDMKVLLLVSHYRNLTVPLDQTSLGPHGVALGQAALGSSCNTSVLYPYTIEWVISGVSFSKSFVVNCALA